MNSRFDRMIETVNVIHGTQSTSRSKRRRAASGSSSTASYDMPRTPVDVYSALEGGRLGEDFSVLKLRPFSLQQESPDLGQTYRATPSTLDTTTRYKSPQDAPPAWLTTTVATLGLNHPLRDLIPTPEAHILSSNVRDDAYIAPEPSLPLRHTRISRREDDVFAFRPPSQPVSPPREDMSPHMLYQAPGIPQYRDDTTSVTGHNIYDVGFNLPLHLSSPASLHSPVIPPPHIQSPPLVSPFMLWDDEQSDYEDGATLLQEAGNLDSMPFSKPGPLASSKVHSSSSRTFNSVNTGSMSSSVVDTYDTPTLTPPFSRPGPLVKPSSVVSNSTLSVDRRRPKSLAPPIVPVSLSRPARKKTESPSGSDDSIGRPPLAGISWYSSPLSSSSLVLAHQAIVPPPVFHYTTPVHVTRPVQPTSRVYFDSPMEDPVSSDPLEESDYALDLDYGSLDFRWERFDRTEDIRTEGGQGADSSIPPVLIDAVQDVEDAPSDEVSRQIEGSSHPCASIQPSSRPGSQETADYSTRVEDFADSEENKPAVHSLPDVGRPSVTLAVPQKEGEDERASSLHATAVSPPLGSAVTVVGSPEQLSAEKPEILTFDTQDATFDSVTMPNLIIPVCLSTDVSF